VPYGLGVCYPIGYHDKPGVKVNERGTQTTRGKWNEGGWKLTDWREVVVWGLRLGKCVCVYVWNKLHGILLCSKKINWHKAWFLARFVKVYPHTQCTIYPDWTFESSSIYYNTMLLCYTIFGVFRCVCILWLGWVLLRSCYSFSLRELAVNHAWRPPNSLLL